jgi:nicotinate-nucleotide adenylyltransferase
VTGLLGGTFDPPHNGHVVLARCALDRFRFERLVVVVVADPGHRNAVAAADVRLRLAEAAFSDLPRTRVELDDHAYTVDLLRDGRWREPLFVVGADEFASFLSWHKPDEILELARLAVATRPGFDRERLDVILGRLTRPERVEFFDIPPVAASSTEVRRRCRHGEPIDDLVPPAVSRLVSENDLYGGYTARAPERTRRRL